MHVTNDKAAAEAKSIYPIVLHYVETHTKGIFAGWTIENSLGFCDVAGARRWISGVNKNHKRGANNYSVAETAIVERKS